MGMSEAIVVAVITGVLSLIGVFIANSKTSAVMQTKIDMLTEEVKKHNHFAERMPVVEEQIKGINRRLDDLERE